MPGSGFAEEISLNFFFFFLILSKEKYAAHCELLSCCQPGVHLSLPAHSAPALPPSDTLGSTEASEH